jgi:hypothetical protein
MTQGNVNRIVRIVHPICCVLDVHKESVSACVTFQKANVIPILCNRGFPWQISIDNCNL